MYKHLLAMIRIVIALLAAFCCFCCRAQEVNEQMTTVSVDDFQYILNDDEGTATVVSVPFDKKVIHMPSEFQWEGKTFIVDAATSEFLWGNGYLTELTLPSTLKTVGQFSLISLLTLKKLTVPGSLKEIPRLSFFIMPKCEDLWFEEGVERIGLYSVVRIGGTIHLPSTLTEFDVRAMNDVNEVDYDFRNAKIIGSAAFTTNYIRKIEFSDGVTIGRYAFKQSKALTDLVLPEDFRIEKGGAFSECDKLLSVVVKAKTPPQCINFETDEPVDGLVIDTDLPDGCILYVPEGTGELYRNSSSWSNFKKVVESDIASLGTISCDSKSSGYKAWNISGACVAQSIDRDVVINGLTPGIYILTHDGQSEKIIVK